MPMQKPFAPLAKDDPDRAHLKDALVNIVLAEPAEINKRVAFNMTPAERHALGVLAAARGWTVSHTLRRGLRMVIDEALGE